MGECLVCAEDTRTTTLEASRSDMTAAVLSANCAYEAECVAGNNDKITASYTFKKARLATIRGNKCTLIGRIVSTCNLDIAGDLTLRSPPPAAGVDTNIAVYFNGSKLNVDSTLRTQGFDVGVVAAGIRSGKIDISGIEAQNAAGVDAQARYAVGIAHVSGNVVVGSCGNNDVAVIQELPGDNLDAQIGCNSIINLTDALQLFGEDFEVRFFNDGADAYNYTVPVEFLQASGAACVLLLAALLVVHADTLVAIGRVLRPSHAARLKSA